MPWFGWVILGSVALVVAGWVTVTVIAARAARGMTAATERLSLTSALSPWSTTWKHTTRGPRP